MSTSTPRIAVVSVAALLAACVALTGCDRGRDADEHYTRAVQRAADRKYRSAVIELKTALQKDADHRDARMMLAETYALLGFGKAAEKEFRVARELGVRGERLDLGLLRASLQQDRPNVVLDRLAHPDPAWDPADVYAIKGQALAATRDLKGAVDAYTAALELQPDHAEALRGFARVVLARGRYEEALRFAERAIAAAPEDVRGWTLKGEILFRNRDFDAAAEAFGHGVELTKDSYDARIGLARANLAQDRPREALDHIEAVARVFPNSVIVNHMRAAAYTALGDFDSPVEHLRLVLTLDPNYVPSLALLGAILYHRGEYRQAEELLTRAVAAAPHHTAVARLLGATHLRLDQPDKAIAILERARRYRPNDILLLTMLGAASMAARDYTAATNYLERAASLSPNTATLRAELGRTYLAAGASERALTALETAISIDPEFFHADYLIVLARLRERDFEAAASAATALTRKYPDSPVPYNLLGSALEQSGDAAGARASYEKATAMDARYIIPALNLARLELASGNAGPARASVEAVLQRFPENSQALTILASLEGAAGHASRAIELLERARASNPHDYTARMALATHYLATGAAADALAAAQEALKLRPDDATALVTVSNAQMALGRMDAALASARRVTEIQPRAADAFYQLSRVQAARKEVADALATLRKVLELNPDHVLAQSDRAQLQLQSGRPEDALASALSLVKRRPEAPISHVLEGDARRALNDPKGAVAAYDRALAIEPIGDVAVRRFWARRETAGQAVAMAELVAWVNDNPRSIVARLALASFQEQTGDLGAATGNYERALELDPDNVLVLNNLAWAYQQGRDPRAIDLAQKLYHMNPSRPAVLDTAGWILVQGDRAQQGLTLLRRAVAAEPQNVTMRYHLAAGLAKVGDIGAARSELELVLGSTEPFEKKTEAMVLLEQLKAY